MTTQWEATTDVLIALSSLCAEEAELQKKMEALDKDEEEFAKLMVLAEMFGARPMKRRSTDSK